MSKKKWYEIIHEKYSSGVGNIFLLYGNVNDYLYTKKVPGSSGKKYSGVAKAIKAAWEDNNMSYSGLKTVEHNLGDIHIKRGFLSGTFAPDDSVESKNANGSDKGELYKKTKQGESQMFVLNEADTALVKGDFATLHASDRMSVTFFKRVVDDNEFLKQSNLIIFVTESKAKINDIFLGSSSNMIPVEVKYPDTDERKDFIEMLYNSSKAKFESKYLINTVLPRTNSDSRKAALRTKHKDLGKFVESVKNKPVLLGQMARKTSGLTKIQLEGLWLTMKSNGKIDIDLVNAEKRALVLKEFDNVLVPMETDKYTFDDFVGKEHLKKYFQDIIIDPINRGETHMVPKGILETGPPGTGKTYFVQAMAGSLGINAIELKISKIMDKYVGNTEQHLEKSFAGIHAMAPAIVFVDEMDQVFSRGGNDSNSVTGNIFSMMLPELSNPDNRGKIIWVGATNYPDRIDEALKRTGRFDKKIPFLPPGAKERLAALKYTLKSKASDYEADFDDDFLARFIEKTEGFTFADIETITVKAIELVYRERSSVLTEAHIEKAFKYMKSASNERIDEMIRLAIEETNDLEFLSEDEMERYGEYLPSRK